MDCTSFLLPDVQAIGRNPALLAPWIDHTLLTASATFTEINKICQEAITYQFASVCTNTQWLPLVVQNLQNSSVLPISVVGFPLGAMASPSKAFEAKWAVQNGAREIDMVISIGALKDKNYAFVLEDIQLVVKAAFPYPVKVILETGLLSLEEKKQACTLSLEAGAHFIKTSTGFGPEGATPEDILLMRKIVGTKMGVKASGGIRTFEKALELLQAGANRIGASSSVNMLSRTPGLQTDVLNKTESY